MTLKHREFFSVLMSEIMGFYLANEYSVLRRTKLHHCR